MIRISRSVAQNILISKCTIRALPLVDSRDEKLIESVAGNELRVLKRYPVAYDLIANLISMAHRTGHIEHYVRDAGDYYSITVSKQTWQDYFKDCGDFQIRQSLARQVLHDLQSGFVFIRGKDKKRGSYVEYRRPFFITATRQYENGEVERDFYFSKVVFQSLVTGECFRSGGEGFIEIPAKLYPRLTAVSVGVLRSHNPLYKINVYGLLKNTHKNRDVVVRRDDFVENVIPEYAIMRSTRYHLKIAEAAIHQALIGGIKKLVEVCPGERIVSNFYIGKREVTIYFTP